MKWAAVLGAVVVSLVVPVSGAGGQAAYRKFGELTPEQDIGRDVRLLAANAAIGSATAGLLQLVRGKPVIPAMRAGAAGGALAYAGKRLAVERWYGAGFLGREVAAVGHSVVRNASEGQPLLERLILPIGPVWLHFRPDSQTRLIARIDAPTLIYALVQGANGRSWDLRESVSSGMLVFRAHDASLSDGRGRCAAGLALAGAIVLSDMTDRGTHDRNPAYAHERVHVLQFDQFFAPLGDPAEDWLADRARWFRPIRRYVDFNFVGLAGMISFSVPAEHEARGITLQTFGDAMMPDASRLYSGCEPP